MWVKQNHTHVHPPYHINKVRIHDTNARINIYIHSKRMCILQAHSDAADAL